MNWLETDLDQPILFRTCDQVPYDAALSSGSLWLRSDRYYRDLEDEARNDRHESTSSGSTRVPLRMPTAGGGSITIQGPGTLGVLPTPHYMLCLHGSSISEAALSGFGGRTLGIRNVARLAPEIFDECSKQIPCSSWQWTQVAYAHSAMMVTEAPGGAPIRCLRNEKEVSITPIAPTPFRKRPVLPFIEQDEWRIVIYTEGYLPGPIDEPLRINVSASQFFAYT